MVGSVAAGSSGLTVICTLGSVSYTHLDVYKRQSEGNLMVGANCAGFLKVATAMMAQGITY